jgi:hypothetical protein
MPDASARDRDISVLSAKAREWVTTPLADKRRLLERLREDTAAVADDWVLASCRGKGIDVRSPAAGEEWLSGPYAVLAHVAVLVRVLALVEAGRSPLDVARSRTLPNGQVAVRVFPFLPEDRLVAGYTGHVWLRPGVTLEQAEAGVARRLRDTRLPGEVGLVLGAGNINSIPPLDALTKLFLDHAVVLVKLNDVNAYLEPILNRAFAAFVDRGFVRFTSGGADVGAQLVEHPKIDTVHITGSRDSHDAIVFGPGTEGAARKAERRPRLDKPVTSELGGVGPVVVVPDRWSDADLRRLAQGVATQRLHNAGFNCVATQIVVVPERWRQADRFLDQVRHALRAAPARPCYYPGVAHRQRAAVDSHPDAELLGGEPAAPRTLLPDLDPRDPDEPAFSDEYFGPVLGVTRLPGNDPAEFLDHAVRFCNEQLYGDLAGGLVVDPRTIRRLGPAFDAAVARLRYGIVAVNCWAGVVYGMPGASWGAFPGRDVHDVVSGVGVVHDALLLDPAHVERSVGRGPFRPLPHPPWFVTNRTAHDTGRHLTRLAAGRSTGRRLFHAAAAVGSSLRA